MTLRVVGIVAISCWKHDCCTLTADHAIACSGEQVRPAPSGSFETVAMFGGHACAVRTDVKHVLQIATAEPPS